MSAIEKEMAEERRKELYKLAAKLDYNLTAQQRNEVRDKILKRLVGAIIDAQL